MEDQNNAQSIITYYMGLTEIHKDKAFVTPHEAEWRAAEFIKACAKMAEFRAIFTDAHIAAESAEIIAYGAAMNRVNPSIAKNVTEKKIIAQSDTDYQAAVKKRRMIEKDIDQFRQMYDVFTNAHVLFRQIFSQLHKESRNGL